VKNTASGYIDAVIYILTVLALMPYTLGAEAEILSPDQKKWVAIIGMFAGAALKIIKGHFTPDNPDEIKTPKTLIDGEPTKVEVTNPPSNPVETHES